MKKLWTKLSRCLDVLRPNKLQKGSIFMDAEDHQKYENMMGKIDRKAILVEKFDRNKNDLFMETLRKKIARETEQKQLKRLAFWSLTGKIEAGVIALLLIGQFASIQRGAIYQRELVTLHKQQAQLENSITNLENQIIKLREKEHRVLDKGIKSKNKALEAANYGKEIIGENEKSIDVIETNANGNTPSTEAEDEYKKEQNFLKITGDESKNPVVNEEFQGINDSHDESTLMNEEKSQNNVDDNTTKQAVSDEGSVSQTANINDTSNIDQNNSDQYAQVEDSVVDLEQAVPRSIDEVIMTYGYIVVNTPTLANRIIMPDIESLIHNSDNPFCPFFSDEDSINLWALIYDDEKQQNSAKEKSRRKNEEQADNGSPPHDGGAMNGHGSDVSSGMDFSSYLTSNLTQMQEIQKDYRDMLGNKDTIGLMQRDRDINGIQNVSGGIIKNHIKSQIGSNLSGSEQQGGANIGGGIIQQGSGMGGSKIKDAISSHKDSKPDHIGSGGAGPRNGGFDGRGRRN